MASVQEILAINNRPGDSIKGGGQAYGITIDASPFQRLAEYTYLDNVEKTKVKAAKDKEVATEMGKAMSLNINTTNKEIYDELDKQKQEILYLVKNNKDIFDYNKNPEANKKWQELYSQFTANREKATAFDLLNNSASTEIAKLPVEEQADARKILENNRKIALAGGAGAFFKTGTQLEPAVTKFTKSDFAVPKLGKLEYQTFVEGANTNKTFNVEIVDLNSAYAKAEQAWIGLQEDDFVPQANPNNDPTIELRNSNAKIAYDQKKSKLGKFSSETLKTTNNLITEYKKAQADWVAAGSQGKTPEQPAIFASVEAINRNIVAASTAMQRQSARGGKPAVPTFRTINLEDGLSGAELVYLESLAGAESFIKSTETGVNTGNQITASNNAAQNAVANKNADTVRMRENRAAAAEKAKAALPPGAATDKGNIIYSVNSFVTSTDKRYKGARVINGELIGADGNLITKGNDGNVELEIPAGKTGAYIQEWYKKYNTVTGGEGAKVKLTDQNKIKAKFENGKIVGILSDNGGYITLDDFQKVSDANSQLKETKYNSETEVGVPGDTGELP